MRYCDKNGSEKSGKALRGIENYSQVDIFFRSYYGALWDNSLLGADYEAEGRQKLWESALAEFSDNQLDKAFCAIKSGKAKFHGALPFPGEFANLCRQYKDPYYGPGFIDKQKVKALPRTQVNKAAAQAELSKCWKLLGLRNR